VGYASRRMQDPTPTLRLELPATPKHLRSVRSVFEDLDLPEGMLEDAQLLTTELITNSLRHSRLEAEDVIEVSVDRSVRCLRVTVRDGGSRALPDDIVAGSIRPSPTGRSGWGLYLVDKLATRWGTNVGGRRGFWFELEEPTSRNP
jgi:anti-sigma regulatory factor (Ser/Thr protein kinase)